MTDQESRGLIEARYWQLEAESEIRRCMARYMELCDTLDADTPLDELGSLFATDAIWVGSGAKYSAAFGNHRGRDAIVAMLGSYCAPTPHFKLNAHFLCSEAIDVCGQVAIGRWMMLQTSTYQDERSDLRAARLTVKFAVESDRWRIAHFQTENLFSRPVKCWDDPSPVPVPRKSGD